MNLIVLGAPGAGKGTQAVMVAKHFDIDYISTGDMLRAEIEAESQIGRTIQDMMQNGELVPDDIVTKLVTPRIKAAEAANGYILDGFPRNLYQAELLPALTGRIDAVVQVVVEDDIIVERIAGRRICPACGASFHKLFNPPADGRTCNACAVELVQRDDDTEETVVNRLNVYHSITRPIADFYAAQGLLLNISGVGEMQDIFGDVIAALSRGRG